MISIDFHWFPLFLWVSPLISYHVPMVFLSLGPPTVAQGWCRTQTLMPELSQCGSLELNNEKHGDLISPQKKVWHLWIVQIWALCWKKTKVTLKKFGRDVEHGKFLPWFVAASIGSQTNKNDVCMTEGVLRQTSRWVGDKNDHQIEFGIPHVSGKSIWSKNVAGWSAAIENLGPATK